MTKRRNYINIHGYIIQGVQKKGNQYHKNCNFEHLADNFNPKMYFLLCNCFLMYNPFIEHPVSKLLNILWFLPFLTVLTGGLNGVSRHFQQQLKAI